MNFKICGNSRDSGKRVLSIKKNRTSGLIQGTNTCNHLTLGTSDSKAELETSKKIDKAIERLQFGNRQSLKSPTALKTREHFEFSTL